MSKAVKTDDGIEYYTELPEIAIRCQDLHDLFQLRSGKTQWRKENVEPKMGLYYLIYSPTSDKYYLRQIHECTNFKSLIQYAKDGNLYIFNE